MFEAISKWASTMWWLETGKTDDYIKKTLKLDGLTGTALKSAPNYAYYEHFLYTREGYMLENWLKKGYSTKEIWARYKLDDVPLTLLKDKDGFKTYLRYATMEDDKIFKLKKQDKDVEIDESNTASEMIAKVDMWVSLDRPSWYVKAMLDLDRRSYKAFHNSRNYWLYKRFEQANDDRTLATWLANKVPTERIWTTFKIDELSRGNRGYKIYVRYAKMKDDETFNLWFTGNAFERESGNIPSEMNTKVEIWADAKRPNSYVKEVLHLNKFAPKTSPNYKYYEKFVELREPV
ncbi:RxLR effector protein [Phytophthora megakarya]|uniref:RxLR effector protein n=1 Tax=Phytophthora megakarya TaxID=4795 RepID=A0A225WB62_9STRA|nr:RxLR effector protein [Phytophthora megakarya]